MRIINKWDITWDIMGILEFKFEKLVVLGIPKTLLLKSFTIELLTLQWGVVQR